MEQLPMKVDVSDIAKKKRDFPTMLVYRYKLFTFVIDPCKPVRPPVWKIALFPRRASPLPASMWGVM